ncbi:hypothetical protein AVEN_63971-1 [Araneus ventricosus]|uniref:Uncharacterized protein n=1 Tax=Araneus ventricosus TaxID=182803 RepID=A0A4Y2KBY3_ARAVE|nr:hypothetical protein AVEN_63971-1 [Araneus ventricosus]
MGLRHKKIPHILLKKLGFDYKRMRIDEESPSNFKTPDSRDVSKVPPSLSETLESRHISASGHHVPWKGEHDLIIAARKSTCFYCRKRTKSKCPNCDKHFCSVRRTGRECFNLYHEAFAEEKFADDEMSSDEMDEDIGHSISNNTDVLQVFEAVSPSHFKTDSGDVLKVPPSSPSKTLDSRHISASGHHASWKEEHFLIRAARRSLCFYCKKRTKNKCPNCDKHFCNVSRTGRECFNSYHEAEKCADIEIHSHEMDENTDHSISNSFDTLQGLDDDDSDLDIISETKRGQSSTQINHIPVFAREKKVCSYCKKGSSWRCKACGKSLCVQKTGETCFYLYHFSPRKAKRPNMKHILQAYAKKSH